MKENNSNDKSNVFKLKNTHFEAVFHRFPDICGRQKKYQKGSSYTFLRK